MTDFSKIKAVVFDAVGTVMYPKPSVAEAYQDALKQHCRIDVDLDTIATVLRRSLAARSAVDDLSTHEEAEHDFWANLIQQLCPNSPGFDDCFYHLFDHFQQPENWRCFEDVADTMSALSERQLVIGIASNFDRRLDLVCDGLVELAPVDVRIISSLVGWRKPAPEFFQAVTDILNFPANEILMVGDDITNDVKGALAVGMPAVLIDRSDKSHDLPDGAIQVKTLRQIVERLEVRDAPTEGPG